MPPLPSHVTVGRSAARAFVGEVKRPTNDQTVSDPVLLKALNDPSGLILNLSVLGARPVPHHQITRAEVPEDATTTRTFFVSGPVPLAKSVPSYVPPFLGSAASAPVTANAETSTTASATMIAFLLTIYLRYVYFQ